MYRAGPDVDRSAHTREAVSAILLAKELIAQHAVAARRIKAHGASGDVDETSLHIAEADRLFSAAWSELDRAREHLRALGRDVPAFDDARARIGTGTEQSVMDVERHEQRRTVVTPFGVRRVSVTTTDATINSDGAMLAGRAAKALADAMPEIDWAAERRAREVAPVDLQAGQKRLVGGAVLLIVAALVYLIVR